MMPQPLLPFDDPPADARPAAAPNTSVDVRIYQPSSEAMAALGQLEAWLTDPRTGRISSTLGQECLYALRQALVEGRNGWLLQAEDTLQALAVRNGRDQGDDIPLGPRLAGLDFHETIEELLDALHERAVGWER
jgi:hypothetical protein